MPMKTERVDWRQLMIDEKLWDYSLKFVPVPPVRQMVEEIEQLRLQLTASEKPAYLRGKRSIVGAAILLPDGTVLCGVRHLDKLMVGQLKAMGLDRLPTGSVQGFIANDYEFETRQSAWLIAERAGQFDPKNATGTQGVLYSEDLW